MKYMKLNTHYLAKNDNKINKINKGDSLNLRKDGKIDDYGRKKIYYTLFLPPNSESKTFFGMQPVNRVEYFDTMDDVDLFLSGTELEYDLKLVNELIGKKISELNQLRVLHELI